MRLTKKALAILLLATCAAAAAAQEEKKDELQGEVIVGPQYFADSDNRASGKFEEFRDVPNGVVLGWLDLHWTPGARTYFGLTVTDLGQRDERILAEFGRQDLRRA